MRRKQPKYEILPEVEMTIDGHKLHRIRAKRDIIIPRIQTTVNKGDLGGLVESDINLSQEGDCWIMNTAAVYGGARVTDNAIVSWNARVYDCAVIGEDASVSDDASVYGTAVVEGNAWVYGKAQVFGMARLWDYSQVHTCAKVYGSTRLHDYAKVFGHAKVYGFAEIYQSAQVFDKAQVYDRAGIFGRAIISENAKVYGDSSVGGHAIVDGCGEVAQHMRIWNNVEVTRNLLSRDNLAASILAQTGLVPCRGKVTAYKQVRKDMTSIWDANFKYRVGKWAVATIVEESDASCAPGLHFSSADYMNAQYSPEDYIFIIAEIRLEDIITVQEGKIRCRKAFIKGKFKL